MYDFICNIKELKFTVQIRFLNFLSYRKKITLHIILTNGLHDVENICTGTGLSTDHLPVICEVITDVRREVPSHFVYDYKNVNRTNFRQCLDSRLNLDFSLDCIEREFDVDSMIQNFTEVILEARSLSVPLVRPNCHSLTLTLELKFIISRKNDLQGIAQNTFNTTQIREYEIQNSRLVRDICDALKNNCSGGKLATLSSGQKSFWNYFTKIIKNKCRSIPALKVDAVTLITGQEKAGASTVKFYDP
jgi:hypothetical protein